MEASAVSAALVSVKTDSLILSLHRDNRSFRARTKTRAQRGTSVPQPRRAMRKPWQHMQHEQRNKMRAPVF
jgi:hypothetical protein